MLPSKAKSVTGRIVTQREPRVKPESSTTVPIRSVSSVLFASHPAATAVSLPALDDARIRACR
jgi:hypothetical protein